MKATLKKYLKTLVDNKESLLALGNETNDSLKKVDALVQAKINYGDKINFAIKNLIGSISDDKKQELIIATSQLYENEDFAEILGNKDIKKHIINLSAKEELPLDYSYFETLVDLVDDLKLEELENSITNYQSIAFDKKFDKPVDDSIEKYKKTESFLSLSEEEQNKNLEFLESVSEVINQTSKIYESEWQSVEHIYTNEVNKIHKEVVENYLDNNKEFDGVLTTDKNTIVFDETILDNDEKIAKTKELKIEFSDETKQKLKNVYNLMLKAGALNPDNTIFGFDKAIDIKNSIMKDIEDSKIDFDKISTLKSDYQKEIKRYQEIFETIKKDFNINDLDLNDNDHSYRTTNIPGEFHRDLALNSTYINMYNNFSFLNKKGIDIDAFLNDPSGVMNNLLDIEINKTKVDERYKGQSFGEKLAHLYAVENYPMDSYEIVNFINRMCTGIVKLEKKENLFAKNQIASDIIHNKLSFMPNSKEAISTFFLKASRGNNVNQNIANLIIANDDKDNFMKYTATETLSCDMYHKYNQFDLVEYLKNNKVEPGHIYDKIIKTLKEANEVYTDDCNKPDALDKFTDDKFADFISLVQDAAISYLMIANVEDVKDKNKLIDFINNPQKVLKDFLDDDMLDYVKSKNFSSDSIEKNARDNFNKYVDKIKADELSYNEKVKALSSDDVEGFINIRDNEIERLKSECLKGKLPKTYYEKRIEEVYSNKEDKLEASKIISRSEPRWYHRFFHFLNSNWYKEVEEYDNMKDFAVKDYLNEKEFISKVDDKDYLEFKIADDFVDNISNLNKSVETREPIDIVDANITEDYKEKTSFSEYQEKHFDIYKNNSNDTTTNDKNEDVKSL